VSTVAYIIFASSLLLQLGLVFRLLFNGCWKRYLWPFLYVCYTLVIMNVALFAILKFRPELYKNSYWQCESISMGLRFLVIWEISSQTFRTVPTLYRNVSRGLAVLALVPILLSVYAFVALGSYARFIHIYFAVERSLDFVQAFLVLGMLAAAHYYGLRFGRNIWGIAVGFGAYVSIASAIFSVVDLEGSLTPSMQVLSPLSFVVMLALWTWALWTYAPNPGLAIDETRAENAAISWWSAWGRMLTTIKRTTHI